MNELYVDPTELLQEAQKKESNRHKVHALAASIWDEVGGPEGLASIVGEMMRAYKGERAGHANHIRLTAEVLRVLERSADSEFDVSEVDREDLEAEYRRLQAEEAGRE